MVVEEEIFFRKVGDDFIKLARDKAHKS